MSIEKIITVAPRGFCAGVARSIKVVEDCLEIFGAPIYVKHAIVHNKTVVADLAEKGAITVETVDELPEGVIAVFSAHGSPPEDYDAARAKGIKIIDATCPLVTKVHIEIVRYLNDGFKVVYVGHRGHVEGVGVRGEATKLGVDVPLVDTLEDVASLDFSSDDKIAILTQTTLSIPETEKITEAIKVKYPQAVEPAASDICYATTNRQGAISALAAVVDVILVVGSVTSSNSNRLVEVAQSVGIDAHLVDGIEDVDPLWMEGKKVVGVSAGASAPEYKVQEIISFYEEQGATVSEMEPIEEKMHFTEPRELTLAREEKQQ